MNPPLLEIVERIARSDDRLRAYIFFLFFSRFEYALKRSGFIGTSKEAMADWDAFARSDPGILTRNPTEPLREAIEYLQSSPPKKQVVSENGLSWEADNYGGAFDLARVLVLIRRVRNNLFHGGKFPSGREMDPSRDARLLDASVTIMQACLESNRTLEERFLEDFYETVTGGPARSWGEQ